MFKTLIKLLIDAGKTEEEAKASLEAAGIKPEVDSAEAKLKAALKDAADNKALAGRLLAEAKEAKAKAEEAQSALDAAKREGMTELEKATADLEAANNRAATAERERDEAKQANIEAARTHGLDSIASGFSFADSLPEGTGRDFVAKEFADVDLADETAVNAAREAFATKYAGVLTTKQAPSGAGTGGAATLPGTKSVAEQSATERAKTLESAAALG